MNRPLVLHLFLLERTSGTHYNAVNTNADATHLSVLCSLPLPQAKKYRHSLVSFRFVPLAERNGLLK